MKNIKRILIYRIGQLGDTIIALPALWALRKHFPSAQLCMLVDRHPDAHYVMPGQALPRDRLIDDWIEYPTSIITGVQPKLMVEIMFDLRRRRFDTMVYLVPRGRQPWRVWRDLAFFRLAGIRNFIGHEGRKSLPPKVEGRPLPLVEHEADNLLTRLSLSGIPVPLPGKGCMELCLTNEEQEQVACWMTDRIGKRFNQLPLIGIGPGSKWPSKVWPVERFAELGQRLIAQLGVYPIIFGSSEEYDLGERLVAQWGRGANAAGQLGVRQAAAVLKACRLYVGNDTGTMHLAAAVGVPCVGIFAAIDWPGRWYPYGAKHIVLRRSVPCEGCLLRICIDEEMRCLKLVSVDDVFVACQQVWRSAGMLSGQSMLLPTLQSESQPLCR